MSTYSDDPLSYPGAFLEEAHALTNATDDGDAWAKFMYSDWFVCPTAKIASTLEISLERRRAYRSKDKANANRIDVLVDSSELLEASGSHGFELPHISLTDLIESSVDRLFDIRDAGEIHPDDREAIDAWLLEIESVVKSTIAKIRSELPPTTPA
jgi:hypothetical protein